MNQERVFKVLLGPHVSEKATVLAEKKGQFVFKVATDATKLEIKKAVESLFSVYIALQPGQDLDFATSAE